ncbi:MAG: TonB-dependent receptor, partial [Spirochaetaceae bacterium]|nr:TonB-dependent receptor [Spirochaetaceae bacterium]
MTLRARAGLCLLYMLVSSGVFAEEAGSIPPAGDGQSVSGYTADTAGDDGVELDEYFDFGEDTGIDFTGTPETTQQMTVITKEEIEKRNAADLAALLEETLDMNVTRYGAYGSQTELSLRGFDTERIAILIDGIPANSPRSGEFDVNQVDLNNVERIEVIYGGSDTKYNVSGALGGVINIVTVKKQPAGLSWGGAFSNTGYFPGSYNTRHGDGTPGKPHPEDLVDMQSLSFFAGYGAESFSWKASLFGNRAGNHYLYEDDYGFARRKISSEVLDSGANASLAWNLTDTTVLLSDTKLYAAAKNFPVTPNSEGYAVSKDFQLTENLLFNAPVIFRDNLSAEASFSYQFSDTSYGEESSSSDHYVTVINRWGWYPSEKITVRTGADWRFLYIDSRSATETNPVKTGNQGGLYLTGEFLPWKPLTLIVSLKGVTDLKQTVAVPKLGLSWKLNPILTLKNNYFRSFKFPDFDDLYYRSLDSMFVGNPNLKPEDGFGADLGGELIPADWFALTATAYGQWTEDSIHWVKSSGGRWSPENIGTAFFAGADARPVFTIPLDKYGVKPFNRGSLALETLKLSLSCQFQFSWLLSGGLSFENSFRIPYMPTTILGAQADLQWRTGSLMLSAHYETTRYADTRNEMPLDPYCVMHLTY